MIKLKRIKIEHAQRMLVSHLLRYPAVLVILKRLTDFPEKVWGVEDKYELTKNVECLVKGLTWEKPNEKR